MRRYRDEAVRAANWIVRPSRCRPAGGFHGTASEEHGGPLYLGDTLFMGGRLFCARPR